MKRVLNISLFSIIFVIILLYLSFVFVPKNNSLSAGIENISTNGILGEKENVVDVLIVGDSESYHAFSPMEIYNKYGITSYVCGSPAQPLYDSYKHFLNTIKTQNIKTIVIETNGVYRKRKLWNDIYSKIKELFPIVKYHNRWKNLTFNDFIGKVNYEWTEVNKGFKFDYSVNPSKKKNHMKYTNEVKEVPELNIKALNKIVSLANKNNINVVFVSTPSTKNWNYAKHNGVEQLSKKYNAKYIDMNLIKDINIDWSKDTKDKGDHLNYYGASKATDYLADYLNSLGKLKDHRSDPYYKEWDEDLKEYYNSLLK